MRNRLFGPFRTNVAQRQVGFCEIEPISDLDSVKSASFREQSAHWALFQAFSDEGRVVEITICKSGLGEEIAAGR